MSPPSVRGQKVVECSEQVVVAARPRFQNGESRGGVRNEDVQQSIGSGSVATNELTGPLGQVDNSCLRTGSDRNDLGVHDRQCHAELKRGPLSARLT